MRSLPKNLHTLFFRQANYKFIILVGSEEDLLEFFIRISSEFVASRTENTSLLRVKEVLGSLYVTEHVLAFNMRVWRNSNELILLILVHVITSGTFLRGRVVGIVVRFPSVSLLKKVRTSPKIDVCGVTTRP